jgi:hypothetical protein
MFALDVKPVFSDLADFCHKPLDLTADRPNN